MPRLVCFGDSICFGYGALPGEAWADRLAAALAALPSPVEVINAGVNGDTSQDGLRRMTADVEAGKPDAVYVQFGLNDASSQGGFSGHPLIDRETYVANMREITRRAFACGSRIVFVATNHPVGDSPYGMGTYRETVAAYNEALRESFIPGSRGDGKELVFIDLERGILGDGRLDAGNLLAFDGVHLSARGNAWYAELLEAIMRSRLAEIVGGGR